MAEDKASRIAIRIGSASVELEGTVDVIENRLVALAETLFAKISVIEQKNPTNTTSRATSNNPPEQRIEMSINSVISKIGGSSARDILLASAAHLSICEGNIKFSREDLIRTAKESTYFKKSYSHNIARDITRLVKSNELIENSKNMYSLAEEKRIELGTRLS